MSRDDEGVGVVHENESTINNRQKSFTVIWPCWLGIIKPKFVLRIIRFFFKKAKKNF